MIVMHSTSLPVSMICAGTQFHSTSSTLAEFTIYVYYIRIVRQRHSITIDYTIYRGAIGYDAES